MKNLRIKKGGQLGKTKEILAFEAINNLRLPKPFFNFLVNQNPYLVEENIFRGNKQSYEIHHFFPFDSSLDLSLQYVFDNLNFFFKGKYIAFADDSGGWQYVISLQGDDYGRIYFCRMDEELDNALTFLADSFEEFINGLEKDDSNNEINEVETTNTPDKGISRKKIFKKGILYFDNILRAYEMKSNFNEGYEYGAVKISNDKCVIDISVDRYYPDLSIYFINPKNNQEYSYGMVMNQRKVFEKEAKPQIKSENENEKIETDLKDIAELMEKYCSDILSGDFTTLEKNI